MKPRMHHYMENLLKGVKVEWKPLGDESYIEIANNARKPVKSSLRISGDTPYYGANNIQDYVDGYTHEGEFILIAEDGSASLDNYSVQLANNKFWANNHVHVLRGKGDINTKFLYYYLTTVNFLPFLTGGGRAKLTKKKMVEILFPIPPLDIQAKIVQILDMFTPVTVQLTAELMVELTARKKQYNYYREKLLQFGPDVEWKTLEEVAVLRRGRVMSKGYLSDNVGVYPVYSSQTVNDGKIGSINTFDFEGESISWTTDGANAGTVFHRTDKFSITNVCGLLMLKDGCGVVCRFLYYWLSLKAKNYVYAGMGNPKLMSHQMRKIEIPIPPLSEQRHIVSMLDKFDALSHSITEGLPREIELRQKQYEYYRDILLSFPKLD